MKARDLASSAPSGTDFHRLVVVSNRLPVVLSPLPGGAWNLERGSGGLVTALQPVLRRSGGLWLGWPGVGEGDTEDIDDVLRTESEALGYELRGVGLTPEEEEGFYLGFSNQVVWPLFHDFQGRCNFRPRYWDAYTSVNRKFAAALAGEARQGDFLWIHDYHLMSVGEGIRKLGVTLPAGFFLHIPFPPLDLFLKLPWRFPLLRSLLSYDLVGFQSVRDRDNFLYTVTSLIPGLELRERGRLVSMEVAGRTVTVGSFPISIDVEEFADASRTPEVVRKAEELDVAHRPPGTGPSKRGLILLGVDRLDYSKGIPHKLRGFRLALRRYPELRGRVSLVQLVVPSREDIPEYHRMKAEIDRLVGEINGEFSRPGWTPVHYRYGQWDRLELLAHYRMARIALVTPLKDGMNLVAKEFCMASPESDGVLILSEHAGASSQLREGAFLVNPYDVEDVAATIQRACGLPEEERRRRMALLQDRIRSEDIHWWVRTFLDAAKGRGEGDEVEPLKRYVPPLPSGFMEGL
ncbi:MAG: trehalose-6-phosphate synthase [Gemmatimonadales bacterium]|nr:MAG: trehalose-6-phosphate synthase [Gemmatimonadales bacterium]